MIGDERRTMSKISVSYMLISMAPLPDRQVPHRDGVFKMHPAFRSFGGFFPIHQPKHCRKASGLQQTMIALSY